MLYNLLYDYRDYLLRSFSPATAETYYKRLCTLPEGQNVKDTVNQLDIERILAKMAEIKHKNHFSQAKQINKVFKLDSTN